MCDIYYDPCDPCICKPIPCWNCMFGYASKEKRSKLLKDVVEGNKYKWIVDRYKLYHGGEK